MTFTPEHFRDQVVIPGLQAIGYYSRGESQLVLATGMAESGLRDTVQHGGGPALGYFEMEPVTHHDLFGRFLGGTRHQTILDGLRQLSPEAGEDRALVDYPQYAAAMCRVKYLSVPPALPDMNDPEAAAAFYVKYYNGGGKATVERVLPFFEQVRSL